MDVIRGAIRIHLAGIAEDGDAIPEPKTIAEYIVAASNIETLSCLAGSQAI